MISDYIRGKSGFNEIEFAVKELPGEPNNLKRFVVSAPYTKKDDLYDPGFWPMNVGIRRFDFRRHRDFMRSQAADFF